MYKIISTKKILAGLVLVLLAVLSVSYSLVTAQQSSDSASGLQISPTRTEVTVKPGASDEVTITLKNVTSGNIMAKPEINDFEADNDTGTPRLLTGDSKSPYTIKDFLPTIANVPLKAGESKTIKVPVKIPEGQSPGAYFGAVRFIAEPVSSDQSSEGRQITLTASLAHIVLVSVPGDVQEQLQIESFSAEKDKKTGSLFSSAPNGIALGLKNTGNSFIKPFGTVSIKNFQGKEVYEYEINNTDPRGNVLPGSTRVFHDKAENISSSLGRYTAVASVSYGSGGEVLVSETVFWVIPTWARILVLIIILAIILAIFLAVKKLRSHNKKYKNRR